MAQPTNEVTTYGMIGIREDLEDLIYDVSPTQTPALSSFRRTKATQTKHEWQTDVLAAPEVNAQIEGDDAVFIARSPTSRIGNYTQISNKPIVVSGTSRAVRTAGRKDELGYQLMKAAKELKRDMELAITSNTASSAGNNSGPAARYSAGLGAWIYTNQIALGTGGAGPAAPDGTHTRTDGSTTVAITEANFKQALSDIYTAGGEPDCVLCSPNNKQTFSSFSGNNATRFVQFDKKKGQELFAAYDVYVSDFGQVSIVPDRFQRGRDVFVLDTDYWKVAYLRPFFTKDLAPTGDADKKSLLVEWALEASNEQSSGGIFDTTG